MKKLTLSDLKDFRDRISIPIPTPNWKPTPTSRRTTTPAPTTTDDPVHDGAPTANSADLAAATQQLQHNTAGRPEPARSTMIAKGSGKQEVATTMAFVRLFKDLMKDKSIGQRFVPIIPDEARTFGLDALVPQREDLQPPRAELRLGGPRPAAGLQGVRSKARFFTRASTRPVLPPRSSPRVRRTPHTTNP